MFVQLFAFIRYKQNILCNYFQHLPMKMTFHLPNASFLALCVKDDDFVKVLEKA